MELWQKYGVEVSFANKFICKRVLAKALDAEDVAVIGKLQQVLQTLSKIANPNQRLQHEEISFILRVVSLVEAYITIQALPPVKGTLDQQKAWTSNSASHRGVIKVMKFKESLSADDMRRPEVTKFLEELNEWLATVCNMVLEAMRSSIDGNIETLSSLVGPQEAWKKKLPDKPDMKAVEKAGQQINDIAFLETLKDAYNRVAKDSRDVHPFKNHPLHNLFFCVGEIWE